MRCPSCKEIDKDRVIDSRLTEGGAVVRRRRQCEACRRRFTTKERLEEELRLTVIKREGSRVPYDRAKIIDGISHACYKLPVTGEEIDRLVDELESDIFQNHDREVTSEQIGEYLIRRLRDIDSVAYVRFMSVYRIYRDVDEFIDEIQNVRDRAINHAPEQDTLFDE